MPRKLLGRSGESSGVITSASSPPAFRKRSISLKRFDGERRERVGSTRSARFSQVLVQRRHFARFCGGGFQAAVDLRRAACASA